MPLQAFIYRHRLAGKRAIAVLARVLPPALSRRLRALAERVAFSLTPQYQGDTLPPIFHYWTGRYLTPDVQRLGIGSPEEFYFNRIVAQAAPDGGAVRVLSAGSGAASMEIGLAARLKSAGVAAHITCLDFNPGLMRAAAAAAEQRGLTGSIAFETRDCNRPFDMAPMDVIIVNQFFHHVTELEVFCASLRASLAPAGVLLTSDIIGRNGHRLWPDVDVEVQRLWDGLPAAQRFDRHFGSVQEHYRSVDHAAYSSEGVRAQDVVRCLLAEFDFELFLSFAGAVMPFIERRVGFNFDPGLAGDRELIDRMQAVDAAALAAGRYPAVNMIAALRHKGAVSRSTHVPVSPERHAELTRQQQAKTPAGGG
jgi:SAM-dependent methyltransferase